jgi:hypothetical protein
MYVVLSPVAKIAATVGMIGGALVVYDRISGSSWAAIPGAVLLFGGALVYFVERIRLSLRKRDGDGPDASPRA